MGNEFTGQNFECVPNQLIPYGPGYTSGQNQGKRMHFRNLHQPSWGDTLTLSHFLLGCALAGAQPGATNVDGSAYLSTSLSLYRNHLWRSERSILLPFPFLPLLCVSSRSHNSFASHRLRNHHRSLDLLRLRHLRRNGTSSCRWISKSRPPLQARWWEQVHQISA